VVVHSVGFLPAQRPRDDLGDRIRAGPTATPSRSVILIVYLALTISHADCPSCSRETGHLFAHLAPALPPPCERVQLERRGVEA